MKPNMDWLGTHAPLKITGMVLGGLALAAGFGLLFGMIIVWLWNALMPGIFGLPLIGYWQGVGLFVLGRLLVGGVRFDKGQPGHGGHRHHPDHCQAGGPGDWPASGQAGPWHSECREFDMFWQDHGQQAWDDWKTRKAPDSTANRPADKPDTPD